MRKQASLAIAAAAVLCLVILAVLLFTDPSRKTNTDQSNVSTSSLTSSSASVSDASSRSDSSLTDSAVSQAESGKETDPSSSRPEVSAQEGVSQTPLPEDSPGQPNVNYDTPTSSYDDINLKVLSDLLAQNMSDLSGYISSEGLTLCPTGLPAGRDLTYSADEMADFLSMPINTFGSYPGSGYGITMSPAEYYSKYIIPSDFDFTVATTQYDDPTDVAIASDFGSIHTVSYSYAPSPMEWKKIIFVYASASEGDALRAIIYKDATTD